MSDSKGSNGTFNVSEGGLYGLAWGGVALSGLFVVARTCIRYRIVKKFSDLNADDYWVFGAWLILIVNALLQTLQAPHLYYIVYTAGNMVPYDPKLLDMHGNKYVRYEFAIIGLFWTVLWFIKASFLSVYWRLFSGLRKWRTMLYIVIGFTFLAYVGCWVASACTCHPASNYFIFGACTKPIDVRGSTVSIAYSTTVDILSDVLIIILPLTLLYKLQVTTRAKIGLACVFSLGIIIVIIAIIRAVEINGHARADPVWLAVWSLVESSISVIVGCLPAFKSLIKLWRHRSSNHPSREKPMGEPYGSASGMPRSDFYPLHTGVSGESKGEPDGAKPQIGPIEVRTEIWSTQEESNGSRTPEEQADRIGLKSVWINTPRDSS